jgi:hypothetical protein
MSRQASILGYFDRASLEALPIQEVLAQVVMRALLRLGCPLVAAMTACFLLLIANMVNPKHRRSLGARGTFDFLQQPCKCQRRICWQQFQSEIEAVKSKRAGLEGLPPHEKAATFQIQSLQFNFQGF